MRDLVYGTGLSLVGRMAAALNLHRPTIFCFHSVIASDATGYRSRMALPVSFIVALAEALLRAGVPVLALPDALARLRQGDSRPFAVLTFDDGYRDNYETLYPALRAHSLPFTIFVTTGLVDGEMPMWWDFIDRMESAGDRRADLTEYFRRVGPDRQRQTIADLARQSSRLLEEDAYRMALTWPMLREMHRSGLVTVGAHTCSHPLLSRLGREEVLAEAIASRRRIEDELDVAVPFFAYPFGQPDEVGAHGAWAAERAGFEAAFTTEARPLRLDDAHRPFQLPRVLLSAKARTSDVAVAYMSGAPAALKHLTRRGHAPAGPLQPRP